MDTGYGHQVFHAMWKSTPWLRNILLGLHVDPKTGCYTECEKFNRAIAAATNKGAMLSSLVSRHSPALRYPSTTRVLFVWVIY